MKKGWSYNSRLNSKQSRQIKKAIDFRNVETRQNRRVRS